jgi:hypothetical protein
MKWRTSGFPLEDATPSDNPGFENRHWLLYGLNKLPSLSHLLIETCAAQELPQGGPIYIGFIRTAWERWVQRNWEAMLASRCLEASELEECAVVLDKLEAARPTLLAEIEAERCLRIQQVLRIYHTGHNPDHLVVENLDWRSLHSRRILFARILNEVSRRFVAESAAQVLPEARQIEIGQKEFNGNHDDALLGPGFRHIVWSLYWYEAKSAMRRRLLRYALAIEWFEAERGIPPRDLTDLLPRYMRSLQPCPVSGMPFHYADRRVWSEDEGPLSSCSVRGR